jgi:hypothetical protein
LETIGILLKTYFRFGYPNGYPVGDSVAIVDRRRCLLVLAAAARRKKERSSAMERVME